jgi:hypothetical protein
MEVTTKDLHRVAMPFVSTAQVYDLIYTQLARLLVYLTGYVQFPHII